MSHWLAHPPACPSAHRYSLDGPDPIRDAYLLHCLNHCAKAADKVRRNNERLKALQQQELEQQQQQKQQQQQQKKTQQQQKQERQGGVRPEDVPRDQGFTRPRVRLNALRGVTAAHGRWICWSNQ